MWTVNVTPTKNVSVKVASGNPSMKAHKVPGTVTFYSDNKFILRLDINDQERALLEPCEVIVKTYPRICESLRRYDVNNIPVKVVRSLRDSEIFENLEAAQAKFPDLDPEVNGLQWTWAMYDEVEGLEGPRGRYGKTVCMRFESWAVNDVMSR